MTDGGQVDDHQLALLLQSALAAQAQREAEGRKAGRSYVQVMGLAARGPGGALLSRQVAVRGGVSAALASSVKVQAGKRVLSPDEPPYGEMTVPGVRESGLHLFYQSADTGLPAVPRVGGWCLTTRESTSPFTPHSLRSLVHRSRYLIRRDGRLLVNADLISEALAADQPEDVLAVMARRTGASAGILWFYDSSSRHFKGIANWGVKGARSFDVPATPQPLSGEIQRGVVSLVRPERGPVVFDDQDSSVWSPRLRPDRWRPRDEQVFRDNRWRSCVALPIVGDGYLVGCISLYGRVSAASILQASQRLPLAHVTAGLQGLLRSYEEHVRTQEIERSFDEEFARSVVSLSVLGIVHDISTTARTLSELIKDVIPTQLAGDKLSPGAERALAEAATAVTQLVNVTSHMKTVAKDRPAGMTRIDVCELVQELEPLLQSQVKQASDRRSTLRLVTAPALRGYSYEVMADGVQLERIVLNLVDNAAYWSGQTLNRGMVVVTVSPASVDEQGTKGVLIAVEDNGPGIDPEVRSRIFNRFFTTRKGAGTGLGLYLAERFVAELGGEMAVDSRPGRTVFSVLLPPHPNPKGGNAK